jgi:cytochrome c-type biogenesis protein CcmH/NrfF
MKRSLKPLLKYGALALGMAAITCALLLAQVPPNNSTKNSNGEGNEAGFRRVSNRILCQCGCGYMVLSCNHVDCSSAGFLRRSITTQLASGKSEDAIVAGFVEQYGPRILPEPPKTGFSLSAWVMPFVVLVLGGALLTYFLWQWKFRKDPVVVEGVEGVPVVPPASPELVAKYRDQIDEELDKF